MSEQVTFVNTFSFTTPGGEIYVIAIDEEGRAWERKRSEETRRRPAKWTNRWRRVEDWDPPEVE
jgi:hypothetical protein